MRYLVLFISFLILSPSFFTSVNASEVSPQNLSFAIWRDGGNIGSQTLTFSKSGNDIVAKININIQVRILGITAYRYTKSGTEIWSNGKFKSLDTQTNDDGDSYKISAVNNGSQIIVNSSRGNITLPGNYIPSTYWHKEAFISGEVFSSQSGEILNLRIIPQGMKTVMLGNKTITAEAYSVSGDISGTYYYSGNTWVGLEFLDSSGEIISYEPLFNF